ncbi:zinc finger, CCHC-type containing protein [Tanacetum coccineum]
MSANQEHVHLAWPLWADLRVIPTHGEFRSLVRPLAIFARSCLVDLNRMTTTVVNNSVFRTFFEKQKLTGPNFIDWYRNLQIVLLVKDKLPFLEQPIPTMPVPPAGQVLPPDVLHTHSAWVKALKEITGLMLMTMDPDIQKNLEQLGAYDMLKELKMFYIDNLERLGHAMTQNLAVSLILVSLRKEYDSFVQNYNMHGMGKTMTELHAMIKLHEQTLPKKDDAPALHAIRAGRIQKNQKKKLHKAAKGNQGKGKGPRGSRKLKPGALSLYVGNDHRAAVEANGEFHLCLPSGLDGIYEIDLSSSNTNDSSMYAISNKRAKLNLDSTLLWHCRLGHISKKDIEKLQHDGLLNSTNIKSFEKCVSCEYMSQEFLDHLKYHGIIAHRTPPYTPHHNGVSERRNRTLLDMVRSMISQTTLPNSFCDYTIESDARILNMVPTKKALLKRDTLTKPDKLEPKSFRTRHALDPMRLHVDAEEHELGDLGEPANYKAALLDPKSNKWLNAMNMEMQSMRDNGVWDLVYLPPNGAKP